MARAKRTDRADARRRHRAALAAQEAEGDEVEPIDDAAESVDEGERPAAPAADKPRSGIRYAFGAAFRPFDLRGDIAALPELVRTRALLVPLAILVAGSVLWAGAESTLPPLGDTSQDASLVVVVAFFLFQYFVMIPPIGGAFLGGFLSRRASWLVGWLIGLAASVAFVVLAVVAPRAIDRIVGTEDATRMAYVTQSFLIGPMASALFAAAAAWYRRFLDLANPNRGRRGQARGKAGARPRARASGRPAARRR